MKVYLLSLIPFREQFPNLTKREIERKAGDYALRKVFSDLYGITDIQINREGKPYIENCPYHFNLSHSGDFLLLAVGECPVGADIEKITRILPKTLKQYFSQEEQTLVEKEGKKTFFEFWTKKESYVKYTGEGIKGLSKVIYPEELAFFCEKITEKTEEYQITVCTQKEYLPKTIEILT